MTGHKEAPTQEMVGDHCESGNLIGSIIMYMHVHVYTIIEKDARHSWLLGSDGRFLFESTTGIRTYEHIVCRFVLLKANRHTKFSADSSIKHWSNL